MAVKTGFTYDLAVTVKAASHARHIVGDHERPILFMDCDGVLNGHQRHKNGYCGTVAENIANLNLVIEATGCMLVIVSAWRYLVHSGAMEVRGLEALLLTHGLNCHERVAGVTRTDRSVDDSDRGLQSRDWIARHRSTVADIRFAAVDDLELDYKFTAVPFVKTDSMVGLQDDEAEQLIRMLTDKPFPPITQLCDLCKRPSLKDSMVSIRLRATGKATVYDPTVHESCRRCRATKKGRYTLV